MDICKAQIECLKTMRIYPGFISYCRVDDKKIFVTPEGYRGFVFREADFALDLGKFQELENKSFLEKTDQDKKFTLSRHVLMRDAGPMQKLVCPELGCHAWVRPKYLKRFEHPIFYGRGPQERFLVYESSGKDLELVGVVLPIKVTEEEERD